MTRLRRRLRAFPPSRDERCGGEGCRGLRGGLQNVGEFVLQPGMQDTVGRTGDSLRSHFPGRWSEQGEQFGRTAAHVLVGLTCRLAARGPSCTRLGDRLIGTSFVLTPDRDPP